MPTVERNSGPQKSALLSRLASQGAHARAGLFKLWEDKSDAFASAAEE